MNKCLFSAFLLFVAMVSFATKPEVIPNLRQWTDAPASYTLPERPRLVFDLTNAQLRTHAEVFAKELQASCVSLEVPAQPGDIHLKVQPGVLENPEGYRLEVTPNAITITAPTPLGAFWGTRTLLQVFHKQANTFPCGTAIDWPQYPVRGFMFDCGRKPFAYSTIETLIQLCAYYKLNDLQLHLTDNYIWLHNYPGVKTATDALKLEPSAGAFRLESSLPGLSATDGAFTKAEFKALVEKAAAMGVQIVPEIDVPGHALAMVRIRPDLMYKGSVGKKHDCERAAMLDLSNPETLPFVTKIFDEYIDEGVFSNAVIHIGTDEYYGDAEEYRAFTDQLLKHIIAKGKTPRFWGSLRAKKGKTPVVVKGTQMHIWSLDWQDPRQAIAEGYDIINILDANAYVVPNGTGNIGAYGDDLNTKPIYETWNPGNFKKHGHDWSIDPNHPRLLGAAWAVWNDNSFMTDPGLCGRDLLPMIQKNCAVFAQKTWSPTNDAPYGAFLKMVQAQAPFLGTTPPSAWERTFTVTVQAGLHCIEASDELALYAVTPHDGKVGFRREGAYYSFDVTLECGKQYELTFASKDRKASVTVRPLGDAQAKPTTYDAPQRQYFPASCRYFTLPPLN